MLRGSYHISQSFMFLQLIQVYEDKYSQSLILVSAFALAETGCHCDVSKAIYHQSCILNQLPVDTSPPMCT